MLERTRWRPLALLLALAPACSGALSSCPGFEPAPDWALPDARHIDAAAELQITGDGLAAIARNAIALARLVYPVDAEGVAELPLGDLGRLDVPGLHTELRDVTLRVFLGDLERGLEVTLVDDPRGIRVVGRDVRFGVRGVAGALGGLLVLDDTACRVRSDLDAGGPLERAGTFSFDVVLAVAIDAGGALRLDLSASDVQVGELDVALETDCALRECDRFLGCAECTSVCVSGDVISALVELVAEGASTALAPVFGTLVESVARGLVEPLGEAPFSVSGQLAPGALLPGVRLRSLDRARPLGFALAPPAGGLRVDVPPVSGPADRGLVVRLGGGLDSAGRSPCAPSVPAPDVSRAVELPELPRRDAAGAAYHVGALVSLDLLDLGAWALHQSGALCVDVTSADVARITEGALTIDLAALALAERSLRALAPPEAAVRVVLRPSEPPRFGSAPEPAGGAASDGDAVATFDWFGLGLDVLVRVDERWTRVLGVDVDLHAGLAVDPAGGALHVVDTELSAPRLETTYSELWPGRDTEALVPLLLGVVEAVLFRGEVVLPLDVGSALDPGGAGPRVRVSELAAVPGARAVRALLVLEFGP